MTTKQEAFFGDTDPLVEKQGDGTHVPLVKVLGGGAGAAAGAGAGGGVIPGVDTTGTKWVMVINSTVTPPTITYLNQSTGSTGTPVGGFTPDSDQNGLTDAQLRASAVAVSLATSPLPTGAATEASLGTDGATPPVIAGTGIRGWLRGIYETLTGVLTVTGPVTNAQLRASPVPVANQKGVPATLTQTVVSVPANTSTQLVAANTARQYLAIQVIGTTGVNLGFGADVTVGNGWAIDPASANGRQGGSQAWDAGVTTQQQVKAIASAATTVVVLEGV